MDVQFEGTGEKLSEKDLDPKNRLGFINKDEFCEKHGFCYWISWYAGCNAELTCQANLNGDAGPEGSYGPAMRAKKIRFNGPTNGKAATGLPGRCFDSKKPTLLRDAQATSANSTADEKIAAELAKEYGVVSAWAIWRDGAVYEFGSKTKLDDVPWDMISTIGGSIGVDSAAKTVLAAAKLRMRAKKTKEGKEAEAETGAA